MSDREIDIFIKLFPDFKESAWEILSLLPQSSQDKMKQMILECISPLAAYKQGLLTKDELELILNK